MRADDAAAAADLANAVHLSYPEDPSVVRDRLAIWPEGCFVLDSGAGLQGYFVCHPWRLGAPPALNTALGALPERPDCLYLHDIALLRSAQGQGHALEALEIVIGQARASDLSAILLVAVGEAHGFWERVGFARYNKYSPAGSNGYGPEATAYIRRL
jgi:GNAT superfamily N-acetyltransferase